MVNVLGIITARGGSKSVPGKNIRMVAGRPLIAWTIGVAKSSVNLSNLVVSTDDTEIARTALDWGAEVPFIRPDELAGDESPHIPVILHATTWMEVHSNLNFEYILLLQPTSPLRVVEDIDKSVQLALDNDADSVISVCESPWHPFLAKRIVSGKLEDFADPPAGYLQRQKLPPCFFANGAIYLIRKEVLIETHSLYTDQSNAYVMPPERSLDVDTFWDLHLADLILSELHN